MTVPRELSVVRQTLGRSLFGMVAGPDGPANRMRIHGTPGPRWFGGGRPIRSGAARAERREADPGTQPVRHGCRARRAGEPDADPRNTGSSLVRRGAADPIGCRAS